MFNKIKKILYLVILFCFVYSLIGAEIPYKEIALKIYKIPYDKHIYNCLNKSILFCEFLKSKNIEAKIIIGRVRNEKFYRRSWIEYKKDNKWYIIDLIDNPKTWGYERKYYWWLKSIREYK
jgi:hypothetical protein